MKIPQSLPAHVDLLLQLRDVDWAQWQHHPITAAYLGFLDDQIALWRENAADLLESGVFRTNDPHEIRNPDVLRGKLIALRQLQRISLAEIQGFYEAQLASDQSEQADST